MKTKVTFIEAAISCGSPTRGTEFAFDSLVKTGITDEFEGSRCMPMDKLVPCREYPPNLRYLDTVMEVSRSLRKRVLSVLEEGRFPFIIGGDHSIAMGSLAALGEYWGTDDLALVYIDAHADINTDTSSSSGCIHGMDLAAACGICCDELTVGKNRVNIKGENIHIIGARSIDDPEWGIVEQLGVKMYTMEDVRRRGLEAVLDQVVEDVKGRRVHISFDVDSLDPKEFTATGYRIPYGLTLAEVERILRRVFATGQAVSFECVEYNPAMDADGRDLQSLLKLFRVVKALI